MASLNRVMLIGRLGQDPKKAYTQGGTAVTNFSLATDEGYTDKNTGNKVEKTEWHRVVVWNKLADLCEQYLFKGSMCHVEGKLQTREWMDKDGAKRYTTEIVAQSVIFLTPKGQANAQGNGGQGGGYGDPGYGEPPSDMDPAPF